MTDFVEVIKQYNRMCKFEDCKRCPFAFTAENDCQYYAYTNPEDFEKRVIGWAAEHPEPKYPTWYGFIKSLLRLECPDMVQPIPTDTDILDFIHNTRIPADIAEKLGIQPEEG